MLQAIFFVYYCLLLSYIIIVFKALYMALYFFQATKT